MITAAGSAYGGGVGELMIRPMRPDDVVAAERLSDEAFLDAERREADAGAGASPEGRSPARSAQWVARTHHLLATDPRGCWVVDDERGLLGFATSLRRDGTWCLATYAVRVGEQGRGIGKPLLTAALGHSAGCLRGMLSASQDARAVRRYLLAGFTMHPQMYLTGRLDRSAIPPVTKVREGSPTDIDLMDALDRATRGSGHGPDHELLLGTSRCLVSETSTGSGYAYVQPDGRLALLAAGNRRTAGRLLWAVLADGPDEVVVPHLTAANSWAIEIGTAARLDLRQSGYLGLRGMQPPTPYVHHGSLL